MLAGSRLEMPHAALLAALSFAFAAKPVVLLSPEDRSLILGPVIQSVEAHLSDLPVELRVEPVPRLDPSLAAQMKAARQVAGEEAVAVIWLELSPGDPVFVYVADLKRNRVGARSVDWDGALGHLEAVGLIVRSSVQAILSEDKSFGFEAPSVMEKTRSRGRPVAEEQRRAHLGFSIAYSLGEVSPDAPLAHAASISIFAGWGDHLYAELGYRFAVPFLQRGSDRCSVAQIWRHALSAGAGARFRKGSFTFGGEIAGVAQIVGLEIKVVEGCDWAQAEDQDHVLLAIAPTLFASLSIAEPLSLFAAVSADIFPRERRYLIDGPGGRGAALTPWAVQPRAAIGLRFELF